MAKNTAARTALDILSKLPDEILLVIINPTGLRTCHKILRKKLIGEKVAAWYPYDVRNDDPIIMKDQEEDRLDKLETLKRRGKGPPKKGQGKRASKRK